MFVLACPVETGVFLFGRMFFFGARLCFCCENYMFVGSLKLFKPLRFVFLLCGDVEVSRFCDLFVFIFLANSALLVWRAVTGVS